MNGGLRRSRVLRRLRPLQPRGAPIDRWYSDAFLRRQAGVRGYVAGDLAESVLEILPPGGPPPPALGDRLGWTAQVGAVRRVTLADVLGDEPLGDTFDAVVCALSLQYAPDLRQAAARVAALARPRGTVLVTFPGIAPLATPADASWPDRWRLTPGGLRRVFASALPPEDVTVEAFGNVLTATAHLYALGARDLRRRERELHDPDFPVVLALRGVRSSERRPARPPTTTEAA